MTLLLSGRSLSFVLKLFKDKADEDCGIDRPDHTGVDKRDLELPDHVVANERDLRFLDGANVVKRDLMELGLYSCSRTRFRVFRSHSRS